MGYKINWYPYRGKLYISFIKHSMKIASRVLLILSITCISYGYWGAFTQSGNKVYDEMDAFLPFFIMIAGIILFIVFIILFILAKRKEKDGPV